MDWTQVWGKQLYASSYVVGSHGPGEQSAWDGVGQGAGRCDERRSDRWAQQTDKEPSSRASWLPDKHVVVIKYILPTSLLTAFIYL